MFSSHDGLCTIGVLAGHAGVSVKTVRFYSDGGLLPEASRSAGGHRRYGPEAVERLALIRSLRGSACRWRKCAGSSTNRTPGVRGMCWRVPSPGGCERSARS